MTFQPGQRVICVNDDWSSAPEFWDRHTYYRPVKDGVYTIREFRQSDDGHGILLAELINPLHYYSQVEFGFFSWRFRPLVKTEFDLSALREIAERGYEFDLSSFTAELTRKRRKSKVALA